MTKMGMPWLEEKYNRFDGTTIDVEVTGVPFTFGGNPAIQTIFRDISDRKQIEERLKRLALYDELTGLPNRSLFYDRVRQLLELAKRNHYILALLYIDLDRFKQVNDTLGTRWEICCSRKYQEGSVRPSGRRIPSRG